MEVSAAEREAIRQLAENMLHEKLGRVRLEPSGNGGRCRLVRLEEPGPHERLWYSVMEQVRNGA